MACTFTCLCCRRVLPANPRSKNQRYCGAKPCQRERRRKWQALKMATDPDYRSNQREAYNDWHERHPGYWRERRRARNPAGKPAPAGATGTRARRKMDTFKENFFDFPGEYIISPVAHGRKMDAFLVKIIAVPTG